MPIQGGRSAVITVQGGGGGGGGGAIKKAIIIKGINFQSVINSSLVRPEAKGIHKGRLTRAPPGLYSITTKKKKRGSCHDAMMLLNTLIYMYIKTSCNGM